MQENEQFRQIKETEVTEEYAEVDGEFKLLKRKKTEKDILPELEVWMMELPGNSEPTKSEQGVIDIYNKMYKKYGLNNDPFTLMCCTDKEYQKNLAEYTRQENEDKFGYDESY